MAVEQAMADPSGHLLWETWLVLALQLLFRKTSESMGNHDSEIVDAGSVD